MLHIVLEYKEQVNILEAIVKDKDKEVSEALELLNKAKLSNYDRKHKTEPFDEGKLDQITKNVNILLLVNSVYSIPLTVKNKLLTKSILKKILHTKDRDMFDLNRIFSDSKTCLSLKNATEKTISQTFINQDVSQLVDLDSSFFSTKRTQSLSAPPNTEANSGSDEDDLAVWEFVESSQTPSQNETSDIKVGSEFKEIDLLGRELEKREQLKEMIKKDGIKRRKKKVW
ncbi:4207_t:CDS:2 [Scutellospora calospora]|uniref:4207_t:CDS:1 n=1 Tax=Scutellospora calospora TaxID=85575 RepID=A0ACA9L2V5_9GLOM|nr:4207_t:CDS:2 [Scutellospora calospora]